MHPNYYENALRCGASKVAIVLEKSYQKYMRSKGGYVPDERRERITGYQLLDRDTGRYVPGSYDEVNIHFLTILDKVREMIGAEASEKEAL